MSHSSKITIPQLKEYFYHLRSMILPFCTDKQILNSSINKLCYKIVNVTATTNNSLIKIGHPLHYQTQFDIYELFTKYLIFVSEQTLESYEGLLKRLVLLMRERTNNFYLVLGCWPKIVHEVSSFFRKIIGDYKTFFKINERGNMDKNDKQKMVRMCKHLVLLIC